VEPRFDEAETLRLFGDRNWDPGELWFMDKAWTGWRGSASAVVV
jgi:hypothetical protein